MSKKNPTKPMRSDPNFVKEIREIQMNRILKGKDPVIKAKSSSRLTLAMTRHKLFPVIKKDIIEADLP